MSAPPTEVPAFQAPAFAPDWAVFLDIDGTLLEIEGHPDDVRIGRAEIDLLTRLKEACAGALALISGRPLAGIDVMFHPLRLPVAGQHGAEWRDARGKRHRHKFPAEALRRVAAPVRKFAARHEGLLFEDKGASVALHYRMAPEMREEAERVVRSAAAAAGGAVEVQAGKMVFELKPAGCDKGKAIEIFMREAPFAGRIPVFLGDDVTDEYGFRAVNRLGGHSIKVGMGPTEARFRLKDPRQAKGWLADWARSFVRE